MSVQIDASDPATAHVTFTIAADQNGGPVSVVGSFNDWTPGANELRPDDADTISATVSVPYDQDIYFRYLAERGGWFDDPTAEPAGDGSRIPPIAHQPASPQTAATVDLTDPEPAPASPRPKT